MISTSLTDLKNIFEFYYSRHTRNWTHASYFKLLNRTMESNYQETFSRAIWFN